MKYIFCMLIFQCVLSLSLKAQISGYALHYDGVDDYVNYGNAATFNVGTTVTYEIWIKPDSGAAGFLFNKWVAFLEDKQITYAGGRVGFYLFDAFGGTALSSTPIIPELQYTHIAATYDGSEAKLYINGVFDTSKFVGSFVGNSSGNLFTGFNAERNDAVYPYEGIIDEFRIWDIARTESEIQSTMEQTLNGNEAGLVAYWKFDEGSGTVTNDATSNNNDGTISGATWVVSNITDVEQSDGKLPANYSLEQNYPNSFNPSTTINYSIPTSEFVTLKVYDMLGNQVATLVDEYKPVGSYEVDFITAGLPTGVYFYKLQTGSFVETKKMILLK